MAGELSRLLACCAVASLLAAPVLAAPVAEHTAGWLYQTCRSRDGVSRDGCAAYLLGVADTMTLVGQTNGKDLSSSTTATTLGICGGNASGAALIKVYTDWVDRHPTQRETPMIAGVVQALSAKWPCGTPE